MSPVVADLAESVDELVLLADVVQIQRVEPQVGEVVQPLGVLTEVAGDQDMLAHHMRRDVLADRVEDLRRLDVPCDRRAEHVGPPLLVSNPKRLFLGGGIAEVDLEGDLPAAARLAVGVDHPPAVIDCATVINHRPSRRLIEPSRC